MKSLQFRPAARSDLDGIWDYSLETWGKAQAISYLQALQVACQTLCDGNAASTSADHIIQGFRKLRVGSHVVFFRENDDAIIVVRILHQRMDVPKHL
ncbi:type II toxin-antitoxin system RelE/ParE family toxin [Sulfitobacter sp. JB4-11]|uniref:type II toxin-antitoxin system RelE/ParE family toxin n=1 Tax=Sulfitobacter rhodophyticola TaxID=3238304 RepID=UPI0035118B08